MKRFTCFNLRSISYTAAAVDIILSCLIWCLCSLYLYHDYYRMTSWSSGRDNVIINKSFNNFLSTVGKWLAIGIRGSKMSKMNYESKNFDLNFSELCVVA